MHREVQLIVSGGIRSGADVAKALALGADAVSIGVAALIALGDNAPELEDDYAELGVGRRLLRRLARGPRSRRHLDPGRRAGRALRPRAGRPAARQLPAHDGARGADARARLRQVARAQPRARGPRGAHDRGRARWRACRWPAPAGSPDRPVERLNQFVYDGPVRQTAPVSYVLTCPNCGPREVTDFGFGGELNPRPRSGPSARELGDVQLLPPTTWPACSASGGSTARAAARGSWPSATPARTTCSLTELPRARSR